MKELGKGKEETFVNYVLCEFYKKNVPFETLVFMNCIFFFVSKIEIIFVAQRAKFS